MPVAPGGPPPLRQVVLLGLGVIMTMGTILFFVTQADTLLSGGSPLDVDAGEGIYRPGETEDLAEAIADIGPLLLPDLAGGDDDIFLQHLGDDPDEGWVAIAVRPQIAARDCFVAWKPDDRTFVDSCDGTVYPESGDGLPHHPVEVNRDDEVEINLDVVVPPS